MERLTERDKIGNVIRGDSIFSDWGVPEGFRGEAIDRLAAYEDLEEQGRLVVLPCKVDSVFYCVDSKGAICRKLSACVSIDLGGNISYCIGIGDWIDKDDIGKNVFLTRAEAEKAMEVREDA